MIIIIEQLFNERGQCRLYHRKTFKEDISMEEAEDYIRTNFTKVFEKRIFYIIKTEKGRKGFGNPQGERIKVVV